MDQLSDTIKTRRSIRKFLPDTIPDEEIREIIEAGTHAPSGCNSQCWHFVAIKDKTVLEAVTLATENGVREFYKNAEPAFIESRIKQTTFFKNAPLVIFVYMTHMDYHDSRVTKYYEEQRFSHEEMMDALGAPDILSIGAAIQNMLLTIHQKGLGACWMNDPIISRADISRTLDVPESWRLMSVIPVGKPAFVPQTKKMKDIEDVLDIR